VIIIVFVVRTAFRRKARAPICNRLWSWESIPWLLKRPTNTDSGKSFLGEGGSVLKDLEGLHPQLSLVCWLRYLKTSIAAGLKAAGLEQCALYVVEGEPLEHDVRVGGEEGVGRGGGARRIRDGRVVGVRVRHAAARTHDACQQHNARITF
jgi:hypothetical protein